MQVDSIRRKQIILLYRNYLKLVYQFPKWETSKPEHTLGDTIYDTVRREFRAERDTLDSEAISEKLEYGRMQFKELKKMLEGDTGKRFPTTREYF